MRLPAPYRSVDAGHVLLTIVGAHCSGKTTAAKACASIPGLVVHDFDEVGVPSDADAQWRHRTMEQWLQRVLAYQADGVDVLLTGQSPFGEVLACPSTPRLNGLAALLLDVADDERLRRLEQRDPGRYDADAKRRCLGWATWLRHHADDPRYVPEAITTDGWPEMAWHRWRHWTADDPRWTVPVVDTTGRTVAESAAEIRHWAEDARRVNPA